MRHLAGGGVGIDDGAEGGVPGDEVGVLAADEARADDGDARRRHGSGRGGLARVRRCMGEARL